MGETRGFVPQQIREPIILPSKENRARVHPETEPWGFQPGLIQGIDRSRYEGGNPFLRAKDILRNFRANVLHDLRYSNPKGFKNEVARLVRLRGKSEVFDKLPRKERKDIERQAVQNMREDIPLWRQWANEHYGEEENAIKTSKVTQEAYKQALEERKREKGGFPLTQEEETEAKIDALRVGGRAYMQETKAIVESQEYITERNRLLNGKQFEDLTPNEKRIVNHQAFQIMWNKRNSESKEETHTQNVGESKAA